VVTIDDVRRITAKFPRSYEAEVRRGTRFRVGSMVYAAFDNGNDRLMGVAFPKEMREGLVGGEPDKFHLPGKGELRYNWIVVDLDAIDLDELRELLEDAWRMVVPKFLGTTFANGDARGWGPSDNS
jgi:hypothetical protein